MRRLATIGVVLWIGRWAALELAAYVARRYLPRGLAPKDSPRAPGHMPGPCDR